MMEGEEPHDCLQSDALGRHDGTSKTLTPAEGGCSPTVGRPVRDLPRFDARNGSNAGQRHPCQAACLAAGVLYLPTTVAAYGRETRMNRYFKPPIRVRSGSGHLISSALRYLWSLARWYLLGKRRRAGRR